MRVLERGKCTVASEEGGEETEVEGGEGRQRDVGGVSEGGDLGRRRMRRQREAGGGVGEETEAEGGEDNAGDGGECRGRGDASGRVCLRW